MKHAPPETHEARALRGALALVLALAACGCAAQRVLTISSEPPGATVRLDDRTIGVTPVRVPFVHFGVRRVTLYLEGHRTHSERIRLKPLWYERFPLDIVSEVLLPFGWRDERALHLILEPGEERVTRPALESVFQRAEILRRAGPEGPKDLPSPTTRVVPTGGETGQEPPEEPPRPDAPGGTAGNGGRDQAREPR